MRFEKEMNLWFILYPGIYLSHNLFEPLVVGTSSPIRNMVQEHWLVQQKQEEVVEDGCALCEMSKTCHIQIRDYLCELWIQLWVFPKLPMRVMY